MADDVPPRAALESVLDAIGEVAVAVSGGVDSMTLAALAHRRLGARARMMHAVSPAVPPEATMRVREHARRESWRLEILDAGEFADARYRENPANRCFYCKTNLYARIAERVRETIVSGTNTDDLGDFRPGLAAARDHGVRHPYVEAGIDKAGVRTLARALGLGDVAELPASPCLSSRIETGIAIDPAELALVHAVEIRLARILDVKTVRCRVRRAGLVVELDAADLDALTAARREAALAEVATIARERGRPRPVSLAPYRMGSAFLRPHGDG